MQAARGSLRRQSGYSFSFRPGADFSSTRLRKANRSEQFAPHRNTNHQAPIRLRQATARPGKRERGGPPKAIKPSWGPQRPSPVPEASQHTPICMVPDLTDAASARRDLTGKRRRSEASRRSRRIGMKRDHVKQSPAPGARIRWGPTLTCGSPRCRRKWINSPRVTSIRVGCRTCWTIGVGRSAATQGSEVARRTVGRQESTEREGTVVRQVPSRGAEVKCGSAVDVWIAVPPPQPPPPIVECRVPDLLEDVETAIEPQLARARLRLRNHTNQESNRRPGTVLRQVPVSGVMVKCGSGVDVWIAVPPTPRPEPPRPDPPKPEPPKPDPPKPDPPKPSRPSLNRRSR